MNREGVLNLYHLIFHYNTYIDVNITVCIINNLYYIHLQAMKYNIVT